MSSLISCIIPTYNRAHLLKDAIEATIGQSYTNWELIVVDDFSSDNTKDIVSRYQQQDARIRYVKNRRKGGNAARNLGIELARGEYIAFLDDDDLSLPHRFESQLAAMEKSGSRFVVSGYQVRDRNNGKVLSEHKLDLKVKAAGSINRWMIRKDLLELAGGFDESFPAMQEVDLSYMLARYETYSLHDCIVAVIHYTPGSVSSNLDRRIQGRLLLLEKHGKEMHPLEAAWWYFITGMEYYALGNYEKAGEMLKKAAGLDHRGVYKMAYTYFRMSKPFTPFFGRFHKKVLHYLSFYKFPVLVDHPVVG